MLNYLLTPGTWWAGYVTAGVFCTWLLIMVGFRKRKNPLKNGMWQLTIVSAGAVLWDIFTGWLGWSADFVIPLAALVTLLSMVIVSVVCRMEAAEYLFYLVQAGAFGLIPIVLLAAGVVSVPYPSVTEKVPGLINVRTGFRLITQSGGSLPAHPQRNLLHNRHVLRCRGLRLTLRSLSLRSPASLCRCTGRRRRCILRV